MAWSELGGCNPPGFLKNGVSHTGYYWTDGRVPFKISGNFGENSAVSTG